MRIAALLVVTVGVCALVWIGGEIHRQNCILNGQRACSVLPWKNGQAKPAAPHRKLPLDVLK